MAEPWQRAEIPGPKKALVIKKPEMVADLVKGAKNPIFIVGHESAEIDLGDKKPIDHIIRIAKAADIPVVATAHTVAEFLKRNFKPAAWMSAMDICNRLTDPEWSISSKGGPHDLALILGIPYYMEWVIESGLKSFAFHHLKTVSMDRFYQPHCSWSFPNIPIQVWDRNLEIIAEGVEKK